MKTLSSILFVTSLVIILAIAILSGIFIGWQVGIAVVITALAFIVAYSVSGKIAISRRDKYVRSEWGVLCKKISWAWGTALVVFAIAYMVMAYTFGDVLDVMPK